MDLKYSHVDILVNDLDIAVEYFERVMGFTAGELQEWNRDGFHVIYKVLSNEHQKFILVQPFEGNLKDKLDEKGEGTSIASASPLPTSVRRTESSLKGHSARRRERCANLRG